MQLKNNNGLVSFLSGITLVVGTGASAVASAATISDSAMFSTSDSLMVTDNQFSPPGPTTNQSNSNQTVQLDLFDTSFGTLTGVAFNLTSALGGTTGLSLTVNNQENGSNGSASASFTLSINDTVTGSLFGQTFFHNASCSDSFSSCMDSDNSNSSSPFNGLLNPAPLASYEGVGTFDVLMNQLIDLSVTASGGPDSGDAMGTFQGQWSGTVGVTYTFDEVVVPVPAAVWLFGSGLLGLLGVARRANS